MTMLDFVSKDNLTQNNVTNLTNSFLFDITYNSINYSLESIKIRSLLQGVDSILCIGCGSGRHINFLRKWFSVAVVEPKPNLLNIVQDTFPEVPSYLNYPNEKFDAIIFLLDSINIEHNLFKTISNSIKYFNKYILIISCFKFEEKINNRLDTPFLEEISADFEQTMSWQDPGIAISRKYTINYFDKQDIIEEKLTRYIFHDEDYFRAFRKNGLSFSKDEDIIIGKKKIT